MSLKRPNMLHKIYLKLLMNFSCMHIVSCLKVYRKVAKSTTRYINIWNLLIYLIIISINIIIVCISFVFNNHVTQYNACQYNIFYISMCQLCDGQHITVNWDFSTPNILFTSFLDILWINFFLSLWHGNGLHQSIQIRINVIYNIVSHIIWGYINCKLH